MELRIHKRSGPVDPATGKFSTETQSTLWSASSCTTEYFTDSGIREWTEKVIVTQGKDIGKSGFPITRHWRVRQPPCTKCTDQALESCTDPRCIAHVFREALGPSHQLKN